MKPEEANKINVLNYISEEKPSLLRRIAQGYRNISFIPPRIKTGLAYFFSAILTVATFGIALNWLYKIKDLVQRISLEDEAARFYKQINQGIAKKAVTPPSDDPIVLKSKTQAFNHINDYVIKDEMIWYRRREGNPDEKKWKPMYFDAGNAKVKPIAIAADGANLTVIDSNNMVHYRKVLIEGRGYKAIHAPRIEKHLKGFDLAKDDKDSYVAIDKTAKTNWKPKWYNFPLLNRIVNFFTGERLKVSGQFVLSQRGRFDDAYADANMNFHPTSIGCTTAYELEKDGAGIKKHDPWVPTWSQVPFYFPENEDHAFVAKKLDVSGSCLLAIGYSVDKKTHEGSLKILTNFCDIDILGGNPLLNYAYQTENPDAKSIEKNDVRVLPDRVENEGWKELPLPSDVAEIYNQITVVQKWRGEREFRFAAKNKAGEVGYYQMTNGKENQWIFTPLAGVDQSEVLPFKTQINQTLAKSPGDYQGDIKLNGKTAKIEVNHFGDRAYHSKVKLKLDGKDYLLELHKRWGLKTFMGKNEKKYELVIPSDIQRNDSAIGRFFSKKKVLPVNVQVEHTKEEKDVIHILPK